MIFVTVGTHEQPFDRLIKCVDEMKKKGTIKEEVVIQTGFSSYEPIACEHHKLIPYDEMANYIENSRIIITHGGPASFIAPLQINKIPIVMPRNKDFDEHVNNHQIEFSREIEKRMKNIIVVESEEELINSIKNYESIVKKLSREIKTNNISFNSNLSKLVEEMYEGIQ